VEFISYWDFNSIYQQRENKIENNTTHVSCYMFPIYPYCTPEKYIVSGKKFVVKQ